MRATRAAAARAPRYSARLPPPPPPLPPPRPPPLLPHTSLIVLAGCFGAGLVAFVFALRSSGGVLLGTARSSFAPAGGASGPVGEAGATCAARVTAAAAAERDRFDVERQAAELLCDKRIAAAVSESARAACSLVTPAERPEAAMCPECLAIDGPGWLHSASWDEIEAEGLSCVQTTYESPIPSFAWLHQFGLERVFEHDFALPGVDFRVGEQLRFLEEDCAPFKAEYDAFPEEQNDTSVYSVHPNGGSYAPVDAAVMHCMVRVFKPRRIVEVGSGSSSLALAAAVLLNVREGAMVEIVCIDPHPDGARVESLNALQSTTPDSRLTFTWVKAMVQDAPAGTFAALGDGDFLVIDSSHVARIGNDVNFLFLEVLPTMPPGVHVHVHDIFFPRDYPSFWVLGLKRFLSEQYLLHMFLTGNADWRIDYSGYLLAQRFPTRMSRTFRYFGAVPDVTVNPPEANWQASAFWMTRTRKTMAAPDVLEQVAALQDF
jgi:hypothetical protein